MSQALESLSTLLNLEKTEEGPFCDQSEDLDLCQVFSGQAVSQALYTAKETIPDERLVHSFYSYFLRPGDSKKPTIYNAETLRDGDNFSTRRVSVIQNGKPILYMAASSQVPGAGFEYQKTMPSAPTPDGLPSETQTVRLLAHLLPPVLKDKFISSCLPEVRPVEFHNPLKGHVAGPHRQAQIRVNGSVPDDLHVHQCLFGYASGPNFLPVALQPRDIGFLEPGIQTATIGHSMWFHRPFNSNEWLLYSVENTSASSACDFMHDEFYTQDGMLVVLTVQGGVMRNHD